MDGQGAIEGEEDTAREGAGARGRGARVRFGKQRFMHRSQGARHGAQHLMRIQYSQLQLHFAVET